MYQKQPLMRKVLYALAPLFLFSVYQHGLKVILLTFFVFLAGILTEYMFTKKMNQKVSEAVWVTCALYTLSIPSEAPIWISVIGIIFGVSMGKMVFGGFGRNIFNPAIVGRLFVYITFPISFNNFGALDGLSGATPLTVFRNGGVIDNLQLLIGKYPGTLGETSALLIIIGAAYLYQQKVANWKLSAGMLGSFLVLQSLLYFSGVQGVMPPIASMLSGSLLFVAAFMITDPVSAPKQAKSVWVYGILVGVSVCLIRNFSLFPEGTSFAILLGNTFAPFFDDTFKKSAKKGVKA